MTAPVVDIRDEMYTRILLDRTNNLYVFNNFTLQKTWFPYKELEDMVSNHVGGIVYLVGQGYDEIVKTRSNNVALATLSVQVAYQRANIDTSTTDEIDDCVELVSQIRETIREKVNLPGFEFSRIEVMRTEDNLPLDYFALRQGTFESYFTAHFTYLP